MQNREIPTGDLPELPGEAHDELVLSRLDLRAAVGRLAFTSEDAVIMCEKSPVILMALAPGRMSSVTRRLLASPLVDLLVGPHGIDRYLSRQRTHCRTICHAASRTAQLSRA